MVLAFFGWLTVHYPKVQNTSVTEALLQRPTTSKVERCAHVREGKKKRELKSKKPQIQSPSTSQVLTSQIIEI